MADDLRTPDLILDSAEQLFADQGFPRTTVKQIAAGADVNSALLYYYFADKEALYGAVLRRLAERIVEMGTAALSSSADPEAALRAIVAAQARNLIAHPNWVRILARELLDAEHSRVGEPARRIASTVFAQLCDTIRRGQASGHFRADVDARFAAISLVGQQVYFYLAHPAVRILLAREQVELNDDVRRGFARHVADFCVAALRAPAGEQAS